ncbi:MAG: 4Fe-4S dicluster domain-containing protein [Candidatus Brocadiia bacterium]
MSDVGMLVIRPKLCVACKRCMIECALAHSEAEELEEAMAANPAPQPRVRVRPLGDYSAPYACRHCEDPPCVPACPNDALAKLGEGDRVALDLDACTGEAKCVKRCPFLGIYLHPSGEHAVKCDLCIERLERGEMPACATACPTGAITYRGPEELEDEDKAFLAAKGGGLIRKEGVTYSIDPDKCIACRRCARVCPAEAVKGEKKTPHEIILERCIQCGACYLACPADAVQAT